MMTSRVLLQTSDLTRGSWWTTEELEKVQLEWKARDSFDKFDFTMREMESQHTVMVPADRVLPMLHSMCFQLTGHCLEGSRLMTAEVLQYRLNKTSLHSDTGLSAT